MNETAAASGAVGTRGTAFYFGIACGRELRDVLDGKQSRATALRKYGEFSDSHERAFRILLHAQNAVPRVPTAPLSAAVSFMSLRGIDKRWMNRYLNAAHPDFLHSGGAPVAPPSQFVTTS